MNSPQDPRRLPGGRVLPVGNAPVVGDLEADYEGGDVSGGYAGETDHAGRAMVVVVGDRPHSQHDTDGPLVTELLEEEGFVGGGVVRVPSEEAEIRAALETAVVGGVDVVITIGGVGVGPRDVTPEATEPLLDQRLDGIAEALRSSGLTAGAVDSVVSRGLVGVSGSTVVVNLAGSRPAIRDGMATLCPLVAYVVGQLSATDQV